MAAWFVRALIGLGILAIVLVALSRPLRARFRRRQFRLARQSFHRQREHLEARFVRLASESGKPRGLEWVRCDFEDDVVYARHRRSGDICAFVGVTVGFEAVEGGGMEDVEAVGNLRSATAVFHVDRGQWRTDGRTLFNLNPSEAVAHYHENLELVEQELAAQK